MRQLTTVTHALTIQPACRYYDRVEIQTSTWGLRLGEDREMTRLLMRERGDRGRAALAVSNHFIIYRLVCEREGMEVW